VTPNNCSPERLVRIIEYRGTFRRTAQLPAVSAVWWYRLSTHLIVVRIGWYWYEGSASPSKIGAKPASGVDIVEIVEVINAKVPASVKPAMPAAKTPKKAPAKADAQAKQ
jgi:hypothetical protein